LQGEAKTAVVVGVDRQALGVLGIADPVKATSPGEIATLKRQGVHRRCEITGRVGSS
jgi:P-type Cu+ transporter